MKEVIIGTAEAGLILIGATLVISIIFIMISLVIKLISYIERRK